MSYTQIANVAGMYPTFQRGASTQKPADTLIQTFIDDVAGEIDAVLTRRFGTAIAALGGFTAFITARLLDTDVTNLLEKINRYGAAAQLGDVLATFNIGSAKEMAQGFRAQYLEMLNELDARDDKGRPLASGRYDFKFDPLARIETPRPGLQAIAGGDQPAGQTAETTGSSNLFSRDRVL